MRRGFFPETTLLSDKPEDTRIPQCGRCKLFEKCLSPKMPVTGEGRKGVLIVAEAPGKDEDQEGIQLIGKSGQRLRKEMKKLGWDLDKDCWKTNSVVCRPPGNEIEQEYIEYCRPNLLNTIEELRPSTIVLLGNSAVISLIGSEWNKGIGALGQWVGWTIPSQSMNAWVCPTYHPSYLERSNDPLLDLWFRKHLEKALSLEGRPWTEVPQWESDIEVFMSPTEAAEEIDNHDECPFSFDYETNMLKPDSDEARIVSCAVCWEDDRRTIAYPWQGPAIQATSRLLRNKAPKYGANIPFEQRWTKAMLGHRVRNWRFDCVNGAHILDNRPGITSVKFQGYVRLGVRPWNDVVAPYLEATGGNKKNRIRQCDLNTLLLYNGLDARVELELALVMMEELGL